MCSSSITSYFVLLVPEPSLPQWSRSETECPPVDSEERQRLMDESEDDLETSAPGKTSSNIQQHPECLTLT